MTPLSLLLEITLLRVTTPPLFTWDDLLPDQAKRLPTELAHIDAYLDDERFIAPWRAHFHARLGRPSIPIPTLLRLLYLKHRYQLGYESLCKEVGDSISWRRFCRIPLDRPVPHPTTLSKLAHRCGPGVTAQLNAALLAKLAADKLLRARKLRIDTTVVEADIDYPTDADLLEGAVGKLGRLVRRIKAQGAASRTRFRDRGRAAGRWAAWPIGRRAGRDDRPHHSATVAGRPAACGQPGDPRSAGVAGRPGRPPDPQRQAAASDRVRLHPAAGRRRTRLRRRPPAPAGQPAGRAAAGPGGHAGGPGHWSGGGHGGRRPRVRHCRRRPRPGRAWHQAGRGAAQGAAEHGSCRGGADPGVSQDAQLAGRDRGADQPPQALVRATADQAAAPCGCQDLGRAGDLRLQPAADDGRGCPVIQQPHARRSVHPVSSAAAAHRPFFMGK